MLTLAEAIRLYEDGERIKEAQEAIAWWECCIDQWLHLARSRIELAERGSDADLRPLLRDMLRVCAHGWECSIPDAIANLARTEEVFRTLFLYATGISLDPTDSETVNMTDGYTHNG